MRYNPATKKVEGRIRSVTREEMERMEQLEKEGVLQSSRHPSEEEMKDIDAMWERRDVSAEIRAAKEARKKYGKA